MKQNPLPASAVVLGSLALMACGGGAPGEAPSPSPTSQTAADPTGAISGVISYTGGDDPDTQIDLSGEPKCQALHEGPVTTERVVTDAAGHLANVFVYVAAGLEGRSFPPPEGRVVLYQRGCLFHPHVFGVQVGQTLVVRNSDGTVHHVHATPELNETFDRSQPFAGLQLERTFDRAEVMVPFNCGIHPWMSAYAGVVDHPFFAVTGGDGSFTIGGLPPGTYGVEVWHEELGTRSARVTVPEGGTAELSFDYADGSS